MSEQRDYHDIPGTYVMDGAHTRKGYHLNMFCMSLNDPANRELFRAGEAAYLQRFPMTEEQRDAVLEDMADLTFPRYTNEALAASDIEYRAVRSPGDRHHLRIAGEPRTRFS